MDWYLAQLNIGRIAAPLESPAMAAFVDNLDLVNGAGEAAPGFVWRLTDEAGAATSYSVFGDATLIPNLTVWTDLARLRAFVYDQLHASFLRRRREWFVPEEEAVTVCWHVPAGHRPDLAEAEQRLVHLRQHGPTGYAFRLSDAELAATVRGDLQSGGRPQPSSGSAA
ncbi:DUF3291 domain-containing protein [Euzebya tangerina]|uniref:DUF3291 domain-containing protein n=1 Tax=Euzebya tangerina TaxID=591198 RepID=UPI000E30B8EB|nr:DUF3291 domain-containing protein [Euzebya tangerina]